MLLGLGTSLQSQHQHAEAIEVFERSLHINRVNDGLYSLSQEAILEKLIESHTELKNWDELDKAYQKLYWINKRSHGDNSPKLLNLIDRVGRWHLKAYELRSDEGAFRHLLGAENLYNKSVSIIEQTSNRHDLRLINALYGIALTNYQIAVEASRAEDFREIRTSFRESNRTRRLLQQEQARQDLIHQSFIRGKEALSRVVEIQANNPILPVDTQAMAMTHLGDWYLLFNKRNTATTTYEQAHQLMLNDGIKQETIDQLFGQPRTLPAIRLPLENEDKTLPENPPYVLASFDVSPSGKARNIEILESRPSDSTSHHRRARKSIAATRFRPRYENGKPVMTTGVSLRYVFTE